MDSHTKGLISKAALDLATGHYLLMKRTPEELEMLKTVSRVISSPESALSKEDLEILHEYRMCTDYSYYKRHSGDSDL